WKVLGKLNLIVFCQSQRVKVEVRRVTVIVRGQLTINAVAQDLASHFFNQRSHAERSPTLGTGQFRKHNAGKKQCSRFTDQVSVWTRVNGWITVHVVQLRKQ